MTRHLFLFSLLLANLCASAQETFLYAQKDTCSLYLDIYRPAASAQTCFEGVSKPAVMFVFGGGFTMGARNEAYFRDWFNTLNDNGYTVVSIDYRLGMKGYKMGKGLTGAVKSLGRFVASQQMGVEDVFSAVSYLAAHPELGVPADNIVLAGSSAGAIISLACANAVANGKAEGLPEGFRFKGVMSFAGGIISSKGAPSFASAPCPLLLFHGTADNAVAYRHYGAFGKGVWGSDYIASQLRKKGWNCCIWRFKGRAHDVAAYMSHLWHIEKIFLERNVMGNVPCDIDALVDDPSLPVWKEWGNISVEDMYK